MLHYNYMFVFLDQRKRKHESRKLAMNVSKFVSQHATYVELSLIV